MSEKKYIPPHLRRQLPAKDGNAPEAVVATPPIVAAYSNNNSRAGQFKPSRFAGIRDTPMSSERGRASTAANGAWVIPGRPKQFDNERTIFGEKMPESEGTVYADIDVFDGIPITLEGKNSEEFESVKSFNGPDCPGIHPLIVACIDKVGYKRPSPVQMWSIPVMMTGRDLMACAQTGSGKTAGFLIPIISAMLKSGPPTASKTPVRGFEYGKETPSALCMSPTRELATQIYEEARKFTWKTGIRPVVVYGGTQIGNQIRDLNKGCDICIGTPGRLLDLVDRACVDMSSIRYFVLDEADRMLDMGFAPQIEQIVSNTGMPPKEDRQTVMFSATFPKEIQRMASNFMNDYIYLTIGRVGSTNDCIRQDVVYASEAEKPEKLIRLLEEVEGLTLIFVDTKRRCDTIAQFLNGYEIGAVSIHGDKSQQEREFALKLFKTGQASVMVATDVASRGLDINNVAHVINVDVPSNIDDYVHRIGRTGRAGNKGIATSLINEKNSGVVRELVTTLNESKQAVPPFLMNMMGRGGSGFNKGRPYRGGGGGGGGSGYGSNQGGNRYSTNEFRRGVR